MHNLTNISRLDVNKICVDNFATRYVQWTYFYVRIFTFWSCISIYHHFPMNYSIFRFSIDIFEHQKYVHCTYLVAKVSTDILFTSRGEIFVKLCWIQQFSISQNLLIVKTQTSWSQRNLYHWSHWKLQRTSHACILYDSADFIVTIESWNRSFRYSKTQTHQSTWESNLQI